MVEILKVIILSCQIPSGYMGLTYVEKLQQVCVKEMISCVQDVSVTKFSKETKLIACLKQK